MGNTEYKQKYWFIKGSDLPLLYKCTAVDPPFSTVDCPIKFEQDSFNFFGTDNQTVFDKVKLNSISDLKF